METPKKKRKIEHDVDDDDSELDGNNTPVSALTSNLLCYRSTYIDDDTDDTPQSRKKKREHDVEVDESTPEGNHIPVSDYDFSFTLSPLYSYRR
jgi:hypothetical protein